MSDVFDRLVARATQRTPVLAARRASRFEPTAATPGAAAPFTPSGLEVDGDTRERAPGADELLFRSGGLSVSGHGRGERRAHDAGEEPPSRPGSSPDGASGDVLADADRDET
jgi:hypothetical protein